MYRLLSSLMEVSSLWTYPRLQFRADQTSITDKRAAQGTVSSTPHKIAIIGGGITGSSTAFKLRQSLSPFEPVQIDLFEASNEIGGQIITIEDPKEDVRALDLGRFTFSEADMCLKQSLIETGLHKWDAYSHPWGTVGIWDGAELRPAPFQSQCSWSKMSWWDRARLLWRYGRSIQRLGTAMDFVSAAWAHSDGVPVFHNILGMLNHMRLGPKILDSAESYFNELGISSEVMRDFAEPCTRAAFGANVSESRALTSLLGMNTNRRSRVAGGNIRLVERLVNQSDADVYTNTKVIAIEAGLQRRYNLRFDNTDSERPSSEYDTVIIAAPLHNTDIDLASLFPASFRQNIDQSQFSDVWVTSFVTPQTIKPAFFDLANDIKMPDYLSIAREYSELNLTDHGILSIFRSTHMWDDYGPCHREYECDQLTEGNRYDVFSRTEINQTTLHDLLGLSPDHVTSTDKRYRELIEGIYWTRRHKWPKVVKQHMEDRDQGAIGLTQNFKLMEGLYYAGGGDELVGSMEWGCRMGNNVAKLVLEDRALLAGV